MAVPVELGGRLLERMTTGVSSTGGAAKHWPRGLGALLASYDLAMSETRAPLLRGGDGSSANWFTSPLLVMLAGEAQQMVL